MHQRLEHSEFNTCVIFISICAVGESYELEVVFEGIALKNNKGEVDNVMGVAVTSDSELAADEDAIVVADKIGCSGKIVDEGINLGVALFLKVLDSYARGRRFLFLV